MRDRIENEPEQQNINDRTEEMSPDQTKRDQPSPQVVRRSNRENRGVPPHRFTNNFVKTDQGNNEC